MEIEPVAVYSEADTQSMHVEQADRAVCIGPPPGRRSYLDMSSVVAAALGTGSDAIHPGYGFLAENADFAALCASQGVTFIGPSPQAIRAVGDKIRLRRDTVAKAGVPVVGGTKDAISDPAEAAEMARSIGMPVRLKARGGGGGRGMRVVMMPPVLHPRFSMHRAKPKQHLAMAGCTWSAISMQSSTSRFKFSPTGTARASHSANAIARRSGDTKN